MSIAVETDGVDPVQALLPRSAFEALSPAGQVRSQSSGSLRSL
jgi:hypothetical protein